MVTAVVALFVLSTPVAVIAQPSGWVSVTSVKDITGNSALSPDLSQPLLAGHAYNFSISVDVPNTSPSDFVVSLNAAVSPYGAQYWYVNTPNYAGFSRANFTPASKFVTFKQIQGHIAMNVLFSLSPNITITRSGGLTLRFNKTNFPLISAVVVGGSGVGSVLVTISDQVLQTYQTAFAQKSTYISSGKVDSSFSNVVNSVLQQAQALANAGLPDKATSLLGVLDQIPAPQNTQIVTFLYVGVGVLAVLTVFFLVLNLRKGSKYSYAKGVASEIEKDLASMEVKVAQYDKVIADRLKSIREKLGEIS